MTNDSPWQVKNRVLQTLKQVDLKEIYLLNLQLYFILYFNKNKCERVKYARLHICTNGYFCTKKYVTDKKKKLRQRMRVRGKSNSKYNIYLKKVNKIIKTKNNHKTPTKDKD